METIYWQRQTNQPLFPELEWDKPERRDQAGRLLIVGGNVHSLTAPATAYETVRNTGVGDVKICLPDKTKSLVGATLPAALFLPSTKSGEFSQKGEVELLDTAVWADCILLPGDNGRNSETAILFEDVIHAYKSRLVITRDAVDTLSTQSADLLNRPETTVVISFAQLQKLVKHYGASEALIFSMDLVKLVEFLHAFTLEIAASLVTQHQNQLLVAHKGQISTTKLPTTTDEPVHWRTRLASLAACYQIWNPNKSFEALTQACFKSIQ